MKFNQNTLIICILALFSTLFTGCAHHTDFDDFVSLGEGPTSKKLDITYDNVQDEGLPENTKMYLLKVPEMVGLSERRNVVVNLKRIDDHITIYFCYLEEDGSLIVTRNKPEKYAPVMSLSEISEDEKIPFYIMLGNPGCGEFFQLIVMAADENNRIIKPIREIASCQFIPNPLEVTDEHNRKMSLRPLFEDGLLFDLKITNLTPMEEVSLISRSDNEILYSKCKTNENGNISIVLNPEISGKKGGIFQVTISSPQMPPLSICHLWGEGALFAPKKCEALKNQLKEKYGY